MPFITPTFVNISVRTFGDRGLSEHNTAFFVWTGRSISQFAPGEFEITTLATHGISRAEARIVWTIFSEIDSIYLLGGKSSRVGESNEVDCYNIRFIIWQSVSPMLDIHISLSSISVNNDVVVVCGGCHWYVLAPKVNEWKAELEQGTLSRLFQRIAHKKCIQTHEQRGINVIDSWGEPVGNRAAV